MDYPNEKTGIFLIDSFRASCENFFNKVEESENNLSSSYIADVFDEIFNIKLWTRKPSETEAFLVSYVLDIKHDYFKALQSLLQGFVSDHYLFLRRGIESTQFFVFLLEKLKTENDVEKYNSLTTSKFKEKYKYKVWFQERKKRFTEAYSVLMKEYQKANNYGVHANNERKLLVQNLNLNHEGQFIKITSNFHDCKSEVFSYDMMPAYIFKLHETYYEILKFILNEGKIPVRIQQKTNDRLIQRLEGCKKAMMDYYREIDPELRHFEFCDGN